jgi:LysM repeat protein
MRLSFGVSRTEKEGMDLKKVCGLLFFCTLLTLLPAEAYLVRKGDSLASLSQKFHVAAEFWKAVDPHRNWDTLVAGQTLQLPDRHEVAVGETWYSLARKWGVEVAQLQVFNGVTAGGTLKAGAVLWVPPPNAAATKSFWPLTANYRVDGGRLKMVSFLVPGTSFESVSDGTVVFAGEYRGVGKVILVESPGKVLFGYGNFDLTSVSFGDRVKVGQVLGKTSPRTTARLVFFVSKEGASLDAAKTPRE